MAEDGQKIEMTKIAHYFHRTKELGLITSLQRGKEKVKTVLNNWGQAFWWRMISSWEMPDALFLSKLKGTWPTVKAFWQYLAHRSGCSFLLPYESATKATQVLREKYPEQVSSILSIANAICEGTFRVLDNEVSFIDGVDWHSDLLSEWRWPVVHRKLLAKYIWTDATPADPILTWELNRHQHFSTLGISYWLTGDQRYLDAFIKQLKNWLVENPEQHGINWFYPLEIAIRSIAWTLAFQFFRSSERFRDEIGGKFLKSIYKQVKFVFKHLQTARSSVPNNHLMAEATALVVIGCIFPEFLEAENWRETGLNLLQEQVEEQIYADGVNKEQAIGYHRFVAELLSIVVVLGRRQILPTIPLVEETLEKMLIYVFYSQTPTGSVPLWGDSDYGRALGICQDKDFWDFSHLLALGTVLYDKCEWKQGIDRYPEEALWQMGVKGLHAWEEKEASLPNQTSQAFPDAGIYIIRDSWENDADVAFFRCGPFGLGGDGYCSHAHCDLLNVLLWVRGRELLVDSGTYAYYGSLRDPFRQTSAHNVLMVDGYEQARPLPFFRWLDVPTAECLAWKKNKVMGGMQSAPGVWHQREVYHPQTGVWEIKDHITSDGKHTLTWFFHFSPVLTLCRDAENSLMIKEKDKPFVILSAPEDVKLKIKTGWYSRYYNDKKTNPLLLATWNGAIPLNGLNFVWKFQYAEDGRSYKK